MNLDYDKFVKELFWERTGAYHYKGKQRLQNYSANLSWDWPDGGAVLTVYVNDILVHAEKGEPIARMIKQIDKIIEQRDSERRDAYVDMFWARFGVE